MRTLKTLKPGENGTKELLSRYGASLLYLRYRYDEGTSERVKTVELVVQRRSGRIEPECPPSRQVGGRAAGAAERHVALRIGWRERALQTRVKSAGGRWDPGSRVWFLRREVAERLELLDRVVGRDG